MFGPNIYIYVNLGGGTTSELTLFCSNAAKHTDLICSTKILLLLQSQHQQFD